MFASLRHNSIFRCTGLLVCASWLAVPGVAVIGEELRDDAETTVAPEDRARIEAAGSVDELINLGKQFVIQQRLAAAALCVERACALEPGLLTDSQRDFSRTWNAFWFRHRARLREAELAADDAAGRVELALWLHEGGASLAAREMLQTALEMDETLPQARTLAAQWHLFGGGPFEFDLTLGLTHRLVSETLQDEGQSIQASRPDRAFLLVPFRYDPGDDRLTINRTDLRVSSDDGRSGVTRGMILLEPSTAGRGVSGPATAALRLLEVQGSSEPIWERLQIEAGEEGDAYRLTCFNTARPRGRQGTGAQADPRQTRTGSGFAAFVVDVPLTMKVAECVYRGQTRVSIDVDLIDALAAVPGDLGDAQRQALIQRLAGYAASDTAVVARAAVGKLDLLRSSDGSADRRPFGTHEPDPWEASDPMALAIDRALLAAIGHRDETVGQLAFDATIHTTTPLSRGFLEMIARAEHPDMLLALLERCAGVLMQATTPDQDAPTDAAAASTFPRTPGRPDDRTDAATDRLLETLPASPAPPNVFSVIGICLNAPFAEVRERALEVALEDGSRQSLRILTNMREETRADLVRQMASVEDDAFKGTVLRVLLLTADSRSLPELLAMGRALSLTIVHESDPLLMHLGRPHPPEVLAQLLELLAGAELSEVHGASLLRDGLTTVADRYLDHRAVQTAALKLAKANFQMSYKPPIRRDRGGGEAASQPTGFEVLLAALAAHGAVSEADAREAATALVAAGRIEALDERLGGSETPARRRAALVRELARDRSLWEHEALPMMLAARLSDSDPQVVQPALASLASVARSLPSSQAWCFNLAVKDVATPELLVELSNHSEPRIAELATDLLVTLVLMSDDESHEFRLILGETARQEFVRNVESRLKGVPTGTYRCAVYVDVAPVSQADSRRPRGVGGLPILSHAEADDGLTERRNVRLPAFDVRVENRGEDAPPRMLVEGRNVVLDGSRAASPGANASASLRIDAGRLLRGALARPERDLEALIAQIDMSSLNEEIACELKYDRLGVWVAEVEVPAPTHPTAQRPLRVTRARILIQASTASSP